MNRNEKISARQFMILVILFTVGTSILITPSGLAAEAKQDAWITVIVGMAEGALLLLLYIALAMRYPRLTLVEISLEVLGKWLGTIVSLSFASFGIIAAATVIWGVGNFVTTELMPETPIKAVNILFGAIVVIGTRLGIESLGRSAELAFPIVVVLFFILVIFTLPQIDFDNMRPVLETGIKPHLKASLSYTSFSYLPLIVLLMIFPSQLANPVKAKTSFWTATLTGGTVMILIVMLDILVLRADITAQTTYVSFMLAGKIRVFDFLQRFEAVVAGIWFTGMFYKTCIYYYSAVYGIAQAFKLNDYRTIVMPLGLALITLSHFIYPSIVYAQTWDVKSWVPYTISYGLFLPVLLLLAGALRGSRKDRPRNPEPGQ
ncbi:endospore germination permease [Paenibacillus sp. MBLB4367]|uniref:GerAB/ArcD/ProY family transporter n=1 Tax=Paenibacillus sp. MBLB4367 TaxID=3384767 RepID=UPI0039082CFF